jgi:4'-phosphopantetheinyl transferase
MGFIPEMQALVDRNFSLAERIAFHSIPAELRTKAFFTCWTRKEAYVKACGDGLLIPLDQFDVSLDPDSPACLLRVQDLTGEEVPWSLHSFDLPTDAIAALVCLKKYKPRLLRQVEILATRRPSNQ